MSAATQLAKHRAGIRRFAPFLLACLLAFGLEHVVEVALSPASGDSAVSHSLFSARSSYQYLVSAWPRHPVPRYTVVVPIDTRSDPTAIGLAGNVCAQRAYMAKLLPILAAHEPAIIVIDKFYTREGCLQSEPTLALQQALSSVVPHVPIVVGLSVDRHADTAAAPLLRTQVLLPLAVREGVVNRDRDPRRIPLGWTVRPEAGAPAQWRNGLALEAALTYDSQLYAKYPQLARLVEQRANPYISQIAPADFTTLPTADILCAVPAGADAQHCASRVPSTTNTAYLRGRIAIVGEVSRELDMHVTDHGVVHGMLLQADYVEALLDERYYRPAPVWLDYVIGFIFFLAFEWSLQDRSMLRAIGKGAVVVLTTFALLMLFVRLTGIHVTVAVSGFVVAIKLVGWLSARVHTASEAHHAT